MIQISDKTQVKLDVLNTKVNELCGYNSNDIVSNLKSLLKDGYVMVGYRASCGSTDRTHKVYRLWLKAVKLLADDGIKLETEHQKVGNSYATLKGGFWNEIKYSIPNK